jgi:putative PEP-CTERM system histidine kinase
VAVAARGRADGHDGAGVTSISWIVFSLTAIEGTMLAVVALGRRPRGRVRWSFGLGMAAFAVEAVTGLILTAYTDSAADRLVWVAAYQAAGLLAIVPWGFFAVALATPGTLPLPTAPKRALLISTPLVLAAASVAFHPAAFDVPDFAGGFYAIKTLWPARAGVLLALLGTIGILSGLEVALRSSRGDARWRVKYLVLGLAGIFLVRFYFLSQIALFNVLLASYVTTTAAACALGSLAIAISLLRDRLGTELTVSRQVVYRSVGVAVLGIYLLAVAGLSWLFDYLGMREEIVWISLVVFVSALSLAALMLSEVVRSRLRRFIVLNFYRSKYDYREQWTRFTKRLGSLVTLDELGPELLQATVDAVEATKGLLVLRDPIDNRYRAAEYAGVEPNSMTFERDGVLVARLRAIRQPVSLEASTCPAPKGGDFVVAVPLPWRDELIGFMLLGPKRTDADYGTEDLEFLATIGEQAAGVIATARLSESLAQAREFEAFHRLTSFVIHDLKNLISALSMLSDNAARHFDDPEFQRDALRTLGRTVDRMKGLLGRLSSAPDTAHLRQQPVDLAALALEAALSLVKNPKISLVKELAPLPPISGDADALLRVIENLVNNAVQAIEGRGVVTLKTYTSVGSAVLAVADTGCGMSEEFMRKSLFSPFQTTKTHGWGIGLYQTKGIVEAHGGTIEVSSKGGVGTTFFVRLPLPE